MMHVILFVIGFLAGPLIFWLLAKQPITRRYVVTLWVASVVLLGSAFGLRMTVAGTFPYGGLTVVLALWLAWITVLSLVLLVIRSRPVPTQTKRIAYGITAAATTLPWFGLYTAQMVAR